MYVCVCVNTHGLKKKDKIKKTSVLQRNIAYSPQRSIMNVCREHLLRDIIVRSIGRIEFLFCKLYVISLSEERKNKRTKR